MISPADYALDDPGWDRLIDGIRRVASRHPAGHECRQCRTVDTYQPPPLQRDVLWDVAVEIVDAYHGHADPHVRLISRALSIGLWRRV